MKVLLVLLLCFGLYGCATANSNPVGLLHKVEIGMTKEDVFKACGSPSEWTRQVINEKTYETWHYAFYTETYDFIDNSLIGYSSRGRYLTKEKIEDVRNYQ